MITAARLKPVDKRREFRMRTYVSAATRTRYTGGDSRNPSPFRIVEDREEIRELLEIPQFEVLEFNDLAHLQEYIQQEMENRARMGLPAVRAQVMTGTGAGHELQASAQPRRSAVDKLPAAAVPPASDPTKTNTGRKPAGSAEEKTPQRGKSVKAPARARAVRPASDDE